MACREDHGGAGCSLAAHGYHSRADLYAAAYGGSHGGSDLKEAVAHDEPPPEEHLGRSCIPWRESHAEAGDLSGAATCGGSHCEDVYPPEQMLCILRFLLPLSTRLKIACRWEVDLIIYFFSLDAYAP